jgi:hypothetical protein
MNPKGLVRLGMMKKMRRLVKAGRIFSLMMNRRKF